MKSEQNLKNTCAINDKRKKIKSKTMYIERIHINNSAIFMNTMKVPQLKDVFLHYINLE